jgi:hypothetical protein
MDEQERARANAWFSRWGKPCPVCNTKNWIVGNQLAEWDYLTPLPVGAHTAEGRYPVLVCTCQTCGYILTVNAIIAGVRQPPFGP